MHNVKRAVINSEVPNTTNGRKYPPTEYNAPPSIGPTIKPRPKHVSKEAFRVHQKRDKDYIFMKCPRLQKDLKALTKVVATLLGNSFAIIVKEAVRKAALPSASMIRMTNASVINAVCP